MPIHQGIIFFKNLKIGSVELATCEEDAVDNLRQNYEESKMKINDILNTSMAANQKKLSKLY